MTNDTFHILNLAAAWRDVADSFLDLEDNPGPAAVMFWMGAYAALLIKINIEDLHSDNPEAREILIDALHEEAVKGPLGAVEAFPGHSLWGNGHEAPRRYPAGFFGGG